MAKIMVVDDSALTRMKCSRLLEARGYDVVIASNGIEALEKYRLHRPDAVLLDIAMPQMDGMLVLKEMKKMDPAARVAMVTALGQRSTVMSALREGARGFVVKPFRGGKILDTVQRLVSNTDIGLS